MDVAPGPLLFGHNFERVGIFEVASGRDLTEAYRFPFTEAGA